VVLFTWESATNNEAQKRIRRIERHDMQFERIICFLKYIMDLREAIKLYSQKIAELRSEILNIAKWLDDPPNRTKLASSQLRCTNNRKIRVHHFTMKLKCIGNSFPNRAGCKSGSTRLRLCEGELVFYWPEPVAFKSKQEANGENVRLSEATSRIRLAVLKRCRL
jgi:hypothetical protein